MRRTMENVLKTARLCELSKLEEALSDVIKDLEKCQLTDEDCENDDAANEIKDIKTTLKKRD